MRCAVRLLVLALVFAAAAPAPASAAGSLRGFRIFRQGGRSTLPVVATSEAPLAPTRFPRLRQFRVGALKDGPKAAWRQPFDHPWLFFPALFAAGTLGTTAQYLGQDPTLVVVTFAAGAATPPVIAAIPEAMRLKGPERWRIIGSHIVFPLVLVTAGAAGGGWLEHALAPGGDPQSLWSLAHTFVCSIIMGGDEPAVALMGLQQLKLTLSKFPAMKITRRGKRKSAAQEQSQ